MPLRVGFVGCGRAAAALHIPAIARLDAFRIVAAADSRAEALAAVGRKLPDLKCYPSFRDLIADPTVDVVAVCAPPAEHARIAIAALAAGKHVYLEKPIAVSLADAAAIRAAAERANGRLVLGFNLRSHRLVEEARALVRSGVLGTIELVRTAWTSGFHRGAAMPEWRLERSAGGGALFEIAVHHLDLLRYLLDDEIVRVSAEARSAEVVDQDVVVSARMRSGVVASIAASQRTTDANDIAIYGQRGTLTFSCYRADSLACLSTAQLGGGVRARLAEQLAKLRRLPAALAAARSGGDYQLSYARHWRRFADTIRRGGELPATAADGERALRAVTAALLSAETGRAVDLDERAQAVDAPVHTNGAPS